MAIKSPVNTHLIHLGFDMSKDNWCAALDSKFFTPQPLRAVGVLFSPMVSGWAGGWAGGGKKFVRAVSQKP